MPAMTGDLLGLQGVYMPSGFGFTPAPEPEAPDIGGGAVVTITRPGERIEVSADGRIRLIGVAKATLGAVAYAAGAITVTGDTKAITYNEQDVLWALGLPSEYDPSGESGTTL
jgi:hypothetical protein